jgi:hypothetical protein
VRSISPGEHDLLAAFTSLDADENGHTIAWRILKTWPIHGARRGKVAKADATWLPEPPQWMTGATSEQLFAMLALLRDVGQHRLLAIPQSIAEKNAAFVSDATRGIGRILEHGRWEPLVHKRGGGAYYSFATRDQDYDAEPDLGLQYGTYGSGFTGLGFVLDLGDIPIDAVGQTAAQPPSGLTDYQQRAWTFVWTAEATEKREATGAMVFSAEIRQKSFELGLTLLVNVGETAFDPEFSVEG